MRRVAPLAWLTVGLVACGGAATPSRSSRSPAQVRLPAPTSTPSTPVGAVDLHAEAPPSSSIRRSRIRVVLGAGPGAFLQRVTLDDRAVFRAGKFHGFRVARLDDAELFRGVDLKPGDVVTQVNGFPIEHPEEALEAFTSLEVASELRVTYERDGVPRELRYAIFDDEPAAPAKPPAASAPPVTR
jgi:hypothetical protein